jgi:hypothetical protein
MRSTAGTPPMRLSVWLCACCHDTWSMERHHTTASHPAVAERQVERVQQRLAGSFADIDAVVGPVDLGLRPGRRLDPPERPQLRPQEVPAQVQPHDFTEPG